jgi:hypothetical protein
MTNPIFAIRVCRQASHKYEWRRGYFSCPGCKDVHVINLDSSRPLNQSYWEFNGNIDFPTITGAIRVWSESRERGKLKLVKKVCEFEVKGGCIIYNADTTHELAGQTVPLPPLPDWFFNNSTNRIQDIQNTP